ncbi:MAG: ETC complex I subunit [Alphaproteobacteria bacterium]|nr:ETC complex I subunit [Alphaproteobacteria bacterium]
MSKVRIYQPTKTAMQSGRAKTQCWVVEYEPATPKEPEPLMGWTSAGDTLGQVRLEFESRDDAIAYCDKHGLAYSVQAPSQRVIKPKAYADNFKYDRVR